VLADDRAAAGRASLVHNLCPHEVDGARHGLCEDASLEGFGVIGTDAARVRLMRGTDVAVPCRLDPGRRRATIGLCRQLCAAVHGAKPNRNIDCSRIRGEVEPMVHGVSSTDGAIVGSKVRISIVGVTDDGPTSHISLECSIDANLRL